MKKLESISLSGSLPSCIIWHILLRLPTKTCLKCKLVCKEWYQIVISPEFGALRSSVCPFFTILLYGKFFNNTKNMNMLLLDLDSSVKVDEIGNLNVSLDAMIRMNSNSNFNIRYSKWDVINECNGLVCMARYGIYYPLIVFNLLTGQQVIVEQGCKSFEEVLACRLGYCLVSSQFKLLRILHNMESCKFEAQVCTIGTGTGTGTGTNEWTTVGDAPIYLFGSTAFLHGSLHTYSCAHHNSIWAFHFGNQQFSVLPLPDVLKLERRQGDVTVFDSCLSLSILSDDESHCEVWVMKEYGIKDSWVKLFVLASDTCWIPVPVFQINDTTILVRNKVGDSLGILHIQSGKYFYTPAQLC